jgi:hypothetical protein
LLIHVAAGMECRDKAGIQGWFSELGKFEVVVETTASYEWFVKLVEPLAQCVVLAHPKKLRVIVAPMNGGAGCIPYHGDVPWDDPE